MGTDRSLEQTEQSRNRLKYIFGLQNNFFIINLKHWNEENKNFKSFQQLGVQW